MNTIITNNFTLHVPNRYYHNNLTDRFKKGTYEKEEITIIKNM